MTVLSERVARTETATAWGRRDAISLAALGIDIVVVALSGVLAVLGREQTRLFSTQAEIRSTLGLIGPLAVLTWLVAIYFVGGYRRDVFGAGSDEYKRVAQATLYTAALLGIGCYLSKFPLSRGFYPSLVRVGPAQPAARSLDA